MSKFREYPEFERLYCNSDTNIATNHTLESYNMKTNRNAMQFERNTNNIVNNHVHCTFDGSITNTHIDGFNEIHNDKKEVDTKERPECKDHSDTIAAYQVFHQNHLQPKVYLNSRKFDTSCSRNLSSDQELKYTSYSQIKETSKASNKYVHKSACPDENVQSRNKFDYKFIHETLQTNMRLKNILSKILEECRRKTSSESWNSYNKGLTDKHEHYSEERLRTSVEHIPKDYSNRNLELSSPVQNLLTKIYECDLNLGANVDYSSTPQTDPEKGYYKNDHFCYPTSSQALIEMRKRDSYYKKHHHPDPTVLDSIFDGFDKRYNFNKIFKNKINDLTTRMVQTDINLKNWKHRVIFKEEEMTDAFQNTSSVRNFKRNFVIEKEDAGVNEFENVQVKLDSLIKSTDSVILAVRSLLKTKVVTTNPKTIRPIPSIESETDVYNYISKVPLRKTKNKTREIYQTNRDFITMVLQNTSRHLNISEMGTSMSQFREFTMNNMDKVIKEEMEKSKRIKKDIQELLHTRESSNHLALNIPTKESKEINCHESEIYFEVTPESVPEINRNKIGQVTMAVNTDPLSLSALLRVSTDTIKWLLSYVPSLNYTSYLSMLPLLRFCVPNYICYICGESFSHTSQLTDHVRKHKLRRLRDCCHYHDMRLNQMGHFECHCCKQRFIRSYCFELHQHKCSKTVRQKQDIIPSLIYLK